MKMTTRCPACGTAFRVQADQLAARDGQVRCGQCSTVFDARATLVTEPDPEPVVAAPQRPTKRNEALAEVEAAVSEPLSRPLPPPSEPPFSDADAEFEFGPAARGGARLRAALWAVAAFAALLALAGQVIYAYRSEIAVAWPESRPWLAAACREFRCTIPLPQRPELLSIESSELAVERGASGVLTLSAVLRNRAGFVQAFPVLELTLTDSADRALARRVLFPKDYLGERAVGEPTLPPGGETAFRLHIDAQPLNATGYRLFVFYL